MRLCRQLMSVPGVGAIVAITFKSGVDDPTRFKRSRDVGPHFGLTLKATKNGAKPRDISDLKRDFPQQAEGRR
jgi:transposase